MDLTDQQWALLRLRIPEPSPCTDGGGRPWADARRLLDGMLWILRTGAQWEDLPQRYGTASNYHRRFQQWVETGVFEEIVTAMADALRERGGVGLSECFVDATFASAKKGSAMDRPTAARGATSWQ